MNNTWVPLFQHLARSSLLLQYRVVTLRHLVLSPGQQGSQPGQRDAYICCPLVHRCATTPSTFWGRTHHRFYAGPRHQNTRSHVNTPVSNANTPSFYGDSVSLLVSFNRVRHPYLLVSTAPPVCTPANSNHSHAPLYPETRPSPTK